MSKVLTLIFVLKLGHHLPNVTVTSPMYRGRRSIYVCRDDPILNQDPEVYAALPQAVAPTARQIDDDRFTIDSLVDDTGTVDCIIRGQVHPICTPGRE